MWDPPSGVERPSPTFFSSDARSGERKAEDGRWPPPPTAQGGTPRSPLYLLHFFPRGRYFPDSASFFWLSVPLRAISFQLSAISSVAWCPRAPTAARTPPRPPRSTRNTPRRR